MKRITAWLSLLIIAVMVTGCWDRRELNDLAIAVGIGLDKNGKDIQVTTQIVNPAEVASKRGGGGYSTPISIISATEPTILEALRKQSTLSPRKVYSSHLRVLVIGEELARDGLMKILDGISRNHEFRSDFYLIIAKGETAENILKIVTPIEKIPANKLFNSLDISEQLWAPTVKMPLDKLISDLTSPTRDTVLTGIRIIGDKTIGVTEKNTNKSEPYANMQFSGIAIFKDDKLVDWLGEEESKGYNYIMGKVKKSVGHLACPEGGLLAVDIVRTKSTIKGKVVNGVPHINIKLYVEENIGEVKCRIDLNQSESIKLIEELASKDLKKIMMAAIRKAQKNNADIFGFGEAIEDADPKSWTHMKSDWDSYFADLDVSIDIDLQIRRLGTINNSLMERKE
jgi:spore germination protein KC